MLILKTLKIHNIDLNKFVEFYLDSTGNEEDTLVLNKNENSIIFVAENVTLQLSNHLKFVSGADIKQELLIIRMLVLSQNFPIQIYNEQDQVKIFIVPDNSPNSDENVSTGVVNTESDFNSFVSSVLSAFAFDEEEEPDPLEDMAIWLNDLSYENPSIRGTANVSTLSRKIYIWSTRKQDLFSKLKNKNRKFYKFDEENNIAGLFFEKFNILIHEIEEDELEDGSHRFVHRGNLKLFVTKEQRNFEKDYVVNKPFELVKSLLNEKEDEIMIDLDPSSSADPDGVWFKHYQWVNGTIETEDKFVTRKDG